MMSTRSRLAFLMPVRCVCVCCVCLALGLIAHVRQARPLEDFQVGQIVRCCVLEVDTHKEKAQEIVL